MTRKRNLNQEELTVENIFNGLSCNFYATYTELITNLREQSCYKRLRRIGEQQFFNAVESAIPMEEESQRIKMKFAEINLLAVAADNMVDSVISEKFQSGFLDTLKDEILKAVLKLYSDEKDSTTEKSKNVQQNENNTELKKKSQEKLVLEKLKDLSKYFAQNFNDISQQVIEMPLENTTIDEPENIENIAIDAPENVENTATDVPENIAAVLSTIKKEKDENLDNGDFELGNLSFDSISSVHTSDLSSFDDVISISSDEETGEEKKKLSLKNAQEEIVKIREKKKKSMNNSKKKVFKIKTEKVESDVSQNDSSSISQKSLPQRVRKPNAKYITQNVVLSPLKRNLTVKDFSNKISSPDFTPKIDTTAPRKRGRPKKI